MVIDLIRPGVEARGGVVAGEDGASYGLGHGGGGLGEGSDERSIEEIIGEQCRPSDAPSDILARVEQDLVDAGRVGLEGAAVKADTRGGGETNGELGA